MLYYGHWSIDYNVLHGCITLQDIRGIKFMRLKGSLENVAEFKLHI